MSLLAAANLGHAYGSHVVLDQMTFAIEAGEKVGLVGRNGCGKSTLMRVLQGSLTPDSGSLQMQRSTRTGYLSQDPDLDPDETLRDAAEGAFAELHELHRKMHTLYDEMAGAEGEALERLLKRQARLEAEVETAGGYAIDHRIDAMLHGLGLTDDQFGLKVSALSGGQKGRLGLARLLLEAPDLLLLDEPTNHLDIAGRQWLETFLAEEYPGAALIVSHDRWLLDRVVDRILEVERGGVRDYPGSYHKFVELRRERQLTDARVYDKQLDHIRREKQFIQKYKTGQRAKQARGRETRLDRYKQDQMVERPAELSVMKLKLPKADRTGDQVLVAEGITKRYGDLVLFEDLDLTLRRGDRVGIIGPNGVGKTTLVRCLLGDLEPDAGAVRNGSRLSIGYYRQLQEDLDLSLTVWQRIQSVIASPEGLSRASEQNARDLAGAFLFSGGEQDKALGDLSGGERSRVVLAGLVGGAHNVLVLDEPTNHLDIPSAERLEQALSRDGGYDGTLLLISHDRALLEATCDTLIVFAGDGTARWFDGTWTDWERHDREEAAAAKPATSASKPKKQRKPEKKKPAADPANPLARLSLGDLEQRIETIQCEMAEVDRKLLDPRVYQNGELCRALQERRAELAADLGPIEAEWERRAEGS